MAEDRDERGRLLPGNPLSWKKGQSGNPRGRPREILTPELRALLEEYPSLRRNMALQLLKHFKDGKAAAIREVLERLDGKVPLPVVLGTEEPESMTDLRITVVQSPEPVERIEPRVDLLLPEPNK